MTVPQEQRKFVVTKNHLPHGWEQWDTNMFRHWQQVPLEWVSGSKWLGCLEVVCS